MKYSGRILIIPLLLAAAACTGRTQDFSFKGRSAIELNFGLMSGAGEHVEISGIGYHSNVETNSPTGSLGYAYWLEENLSLAISVGFLSAKVHSTMDGYKILREVSSVIPVMAGIRLYVPEPDSGSRFRIFFPLAIGLYLGSESFNSTYTQWIHNEVAFGIRSGAGAEFFITDNLKLGLNAGYHLFITEFNNPIGSRKRYNGFELTLGTGYIF
jgi:opacity protein-like surface antigen